MILFKRLWPNTLASRFVLLLAVAILAANVIGLIVLNLQQDRFDRQAVDDRRIAQIAGIVPVMETVNSDVRRVVAREASSRFARVRVGGTPLVTQTTTDSRSDYISQGLAEALGRDDVIVALVDRPPSQAGRNRTDDVWAGRVIAVTVPLSNKSGRAEWLNITSRDGSPRGGAVGVTPKPFLTFLFLSLLSVLGVGAVFARQLTKPLRHLSLAAQASGRGDRSARVPEEGPREIREAARAFNAMQVEISQFDAERMRMLAAIGHDLRTPMTSLRIRAEMVEDEAQRSAMVRTLDQMTVMADGLVSYAKDGRDGEDMQPLDLCSLLELLCADRGVHYSGESGVQVLGRRVGLGRAIGNLIDNAVSYGTDPTVTLHRDKRKAVVIIKDTGPGIPQDRVDDMFRPFTRGDNSRSVETGGAGLGLSIAQTIITAHGGTVTLENLAEGGLRATVTLSGDG